MKTNVFLLSGYARSGKDTVGEYLKLIASQIVLDTKEVCLHTDKFAKPLYDMLIAMYDYTYDFSFIDNHKNDRMPHTECTWRTALQKLGTEFGRDVLGSDIWAKLAVDRVLHESAFSGYVVKVDGSYTMKASNFFIFSDCRFMNEFNVFKSDDRFNTHLIYVERKESQPQTHHRSEQQILELKANADYIISNNQSVDDLYNKVNTVVLNIFDNIE